MKFILICDERYQSTELKRFIDSVPSSHQLEALSTEQVLQGQLLPDGDIYFVEKRSWQLGYSLLKYFNTVSQFDAVNFAILTKGRKQGPLKGRLGRKDTYFHIPSNPIDFEKGVENYFNGVNERLDLLKTARK